WDGLPLHFTSGYIDPDDALAALHHREEKGRGDRGSLRGTHMWFPPRQVVVWIFPATTSTSSPLISGAISGSTSTRTATGSRALV
ncbi:hypothetical protein SCB29_39440, partial [Paraburkholderia sp. SIMBA_055]